MSLVRDPRGQKRGHQVADEWVFGQGSLQQAPGATACRGPRAASSAGVGRPCHAHQHASGELFVSGPHKHMAAMCFVKLFSLFAGRAAASRDAGAVWWPSPGCIGARNWQGPPCRRFSCSQQPARSWPRVNGSGPRQCASRPRWQEKSVPSRVGPRTTAMPSLSFSEGLGRLLPVRSGGCAAPAARTLQPGWGGANWPRHRPLPGRVEQLAHGVDPRGDVSSAGRGGPARLPVAQPRRLAGMPSIRDPTGQMLVEAPRSIQRARQSKALWLSGALGCPASTKRRLDQEHAPRCCARCLPKLGASNP